MRTGVWLHAAARAAVAAMRPCRRSRGEGGGSSAGAGALCDDSPRLRMDGRRFMLDRWCLWFSEAVVVRDEEVEVLDGSLHWKLSEQFFHWIGSLQSLTRWSLARHR